MMRLVLTWERYTDASVEAGDADARGFLAPGSLAHNGRGKQATIAQAIEALQATDDQHAEAWDWCYVELSENGWGEFCVRATQRPHRPIMPVTEHTVLMAGTRREAKRFLVELAKAGVIDDRFAFDRSVARGYLVRRAP